MAFDIASTQAWPAAVAAPARRARHASTREFLQAAITDTYRGRIALVSSFGTEAAVLLHLVASIDRATPVLFIDTLKLFPETLRYRDLLTARLGLSDVRTIHPDAARLAQDDPDGDLWRRDPDHCCVIRKVEPLARALAGFDAWINGRKRFQGGARAALSPVEHADGRIKLNPLADWSVEDIDGYFAVHNLPRHLLEADGFTSIGCMTCSAPTLPGEDRRAGRWRGQGKTECGIHLALTPPPRGEE
ncbi:phosphoadenylyl-sulfate reductase [Vineibacter terrae]|uniref:phosphoadenylyl-sulfate reductase n=1 Tax=Vineibacter terrae TaxID=2586908 RepID=UPI002E36599E|nr:phosphoadenylyl-sulfate reductase [Vineibacter terrae]HEX2886744.1 phosphoadenylyl-sulfate reductase [Vineibacter terrae]